MKTSVIIHGHFYQPPRENPYTGIIEDQKTAFPFINWNEAIYMTCYRPNAFSRYLSYDGKIEKISNNYSSISCDFGPTLLNWIEQEHPDFSEKLLQADSDSIKRFGHSNIMAQSYNHTILPLAEKKDRRIQIAWALEDYEARFGHKSEGFWCPECAINEDVIDDLVLAGIKFVVLSPYQASEINGIPLNGTPAPFDRPFVVRGKKKSISAFFYDGELASGISFGHYLRDADSLYSRLLEKKEKSGNPSLIHWATDGEIYGHHEPFGDMALAALIKKIEDKDDFEITNYGAYLNSHPATDEAKLWDGDDGLGSSWSCCHGVGRWYTDCGCHTGGDDSWNQKWRTPMRRSFSLLEKKITSISENQFKNILGNSADYTEIVSGYASVLSGRTDIVSYILSLKKDADTDEIREIANLLDIIKNMQFMFTSCGWFFNDISGIEPRQNISYACYAASGIQKSFNENLVKNLLTGLRSAQSNANGVGNGKDIAESVLNAQNPLFDIACFFILNRNIAPDEEKNSSYGCFLLLSFCEDYLTIRNTNTLKETEFRYSWISEQKAIEIEDTETGQRRIYGKKNYPQNTVRFFKSWLNRSLASCIDEKTLLSVSERLDSYMYLTDGNTSSPDDSILYENIGICIKAIRKLDLNKENRDSASLFIERLIKFTKACGRKEDIDRLTQALNERIRKIAALISSGKNKKENMMSILSIVSLVHKEELKADITEAQDVLYPILFNNDSNIDAIIIQRLKEQLNFRY